MFVDADAYRCRVMRVESPLTAQVLGGEPWDASSEWSIPTPAVPCGEIVRLTFPISATHRSLALSVREPNGPLNLIGEAVVEISGWVKTYDGAITVVMHGNTTPGIVIPGIASGIERGECAHEA